MPRKRAVLVGINYTSDEESALQGCVNDIYDVYTLLVRRGYTEFLLMYDAPWPESGTNTVSLPSEYSPTKENILNGIKWLVNDSVEGDQLFFHFSGHGSYLRDTNKDEADRMDECLVPADYKEQGFITDDTLRALILPALQKSKAKLRALFDCCHSGTGMDLKNNLRITSSRSQQPQQLSNTSEPGGGPPVVPSSFYYPGPAPTMSLVDYMTESMVTASVYKQLSLWFGEQTVYDTYQEIQARACPIHIDQWANSNPNEWVTVPYTDLIEQPEEATDRSLSSSYVPDVIMLSGCLDHQTSADATFDGRANGALTRAFIISIMSTLSPPVRALPLLRELHGFMRKNGFTQLPQLSSERAINSSTIFDL
jgi:hypothetical protein